MCPITHGPGGTLITGKDGMHIYRCLTLLAGMRLEVKGLRLTSKASTCYSIIKKEFGLRGNKAKVLDQFETMVREMQAHKGHLASVPK